MNAAALAGAAGGALISLLVAPLAVARAPQALTRVNWRGRPVPAVLGFPLAASGVIVAGAFAARYPEEARSAGAVGLVVAVMAAAGYYDDRRGDEQERGFHGHLAAARDKRLTGGAIKIAGAAAGGMVAGALVLDGWAVLETALLVALTANAVNLLDRAPGRAGKAALFAWLPLLVWGDAVWSAASAGLLGALLVCLVLDLRARAMLGDAGANPLGAVLGLGLSVSLPPQGRVAAVLGLLALNLASERWSFSAIIERVRVLSAVDRLGRRGS
ncbi:MAG: hypothetical protein H0V97_06315 [Actinobacteria bacterium]|nr:hypothetical protein [Actinomycetota bacterium]